MDDEVGNDTTVVRVHTGSESVEDTGDTDINAVLAGVAVGQGLGYTLAFVVARTGTDTVDVTPVVLTLRVLLGVTVDLGGGGDEESSLGTLGKTQHVQGTHERGLDGLDRVVLVVRGGCGACKVVDLVDLDKEGVDDVVADNLEVGVANPVRNGSPATGKEVVKDGDLVTQKHESVDQVGTNETGTTGDEDSLTLRVGEELDRGELGDSGVLDRVGVGIVGRLDTVVLVLGRGEVLGLVTRLDVAGGLGMIRKRHSRQHGETSQRR